MTKEQLVALGIDEKLAEKAAAASAEELKGYVAQADYAAADAAKKQAEKLLKERDTQLEQLKAGTGDAEALKTQIIELQAQNAQKEAEHAAELQRMRIDGAIEKALVAAKVINLKMARAVLEIDPEKAEFDEAGNIKGLDERIEKLKTSKDTKVLFPDEKAPTFKGFVPGEARDGLPGNTDPNKMNYAELCAYMEANPDAQI